MRHSAHTSRILLLALLVANTYFTDAKTLSTCEIVRELTRKEVQRSFISSWVCLIQNESGGDTMKVTNATSSNRYGLFHISSRGGCGKGYLGGACNMRCESLLTDGKLDDNVSCAMKIFNLNGFKDWKGWVNKCKKQTLPNVSNCRV